jgi:hypothetical protein
MHVAPISSASTISESVGREGVNRTNDVLVVQKLLNAAGAGIKEDGDCGRATISAIEEYQQNWTGHPDGRVDASGMTWKHLLGGKLKVKRQGYILLSQISGNGYYPYSTMDRQYGTMATVSALIQVCKQFVQKYPTLLVGIGDMSFANGAKMSPHKTHRDGHNADIRPLRKDGKKLPVTIADDAYSRDYTRALVETLRAHLNLRSILFNDSAIAGVTPWEGHDNHLHVSMKK